MSFIMGKGMDNTVLFRYTGSIPHFYPIFIKIIEEKA